MSDDDAEYDAMLDVIEILTAEGARLKAVTDDGRLTFDGDGDRAEDR